MKGIVKLVCYCVLVLVVNINEVFSQRSPCPGTFDYIRVGSDIYGKIVIPPSGPTSQLVVQAKFTVTVRLYSNYYGSLEQENANFALQNYNRGSPMQFRVHFPVTSPLPRLTSLEVNGQTICSGPGDTLRPNRYLTTFSLQHTSYFQGGGQAFPPAQLYPASNAYDDYDNNSQDNSYDATTSSYTKPTYRPSGQSFGNQNEYYPNGNRPQKGPPFQTTVDDQSQYYPPEITYVTPKPSTPPRTQRPSQTQDVECGIPSRSLNSISLIYGGEEYSKGDHPWLVAIFKKTGFNLMFKCGGSLISNRHVVTAAHCMGRSDNRFKTKDMLIKLGVHKLSDVEDNDVITRGLIDATVHELYNSSSFQNDISVLTLDKEVKFSMYIKPVCLWDSNPDLDLIIRDASGVVAGWGDQEHHRGGADQPKLVHMKIVSTEECRESNKQFVDQTSDKTFCAGDRNGIGPCSGDSGGGMYIVDKKRWKLRGIVSSALKSLDGSCDLDQYVVFTDAAKYIPWIHRVLSKRYD